MARVREIFESSLFDEEEDAAYQSDRIVNADTPLDNLEVLPSRSSRQDCVQLLETLLREADSMPVVMDESKYLRLVSIGRCTSSRDAAAPVVFAPTL